MRLKSTFFILFSTLLMGQARLTPLPVDIRQRVIDDRKLQVIVEVENKTGKIITRLEGFLYSKTLSGATEAERHLVFIDPYESLKNGTSRNVTEFYPYDPLDPRDFTFRISRLKFRDDPRVYTYHPLAGFIRIE